MSAAGKVSVRNGASIWQEGKDSSCRWRCNQVHLFLPRACCRYSSLSHANVQISLLLGAAHGGLEDEGNILTKQQGWEHSSEGLEAPSCSKDPATRHPKCPFSPLFPPLLPGKLVKNTKGSGGGWAGGCSRGWLGATGRSGQPVGISMLLEHISEGCEMSHPCRARMSPLAGAAVLTQEGLLGCPGAQ